MAPCQGRGIWGGLRGRAGAGSLPRSTQVRHFHPESNEPEQFSGGGEDSSSLKIFK